MPIIARREMLKMASGVPAARRYGRRPCGSPLRFHQVNRYDQSASFLERRGAAYGDSARTRHSPVRGLTFTRQLISHGGQNSKHSSLPRPDHFCDPTDTGVACIQVILPIKNPIAGFDELAWAYTHSVTDRTEYL